MISDNTLTHLAGLHASSVTGLGGLQRLMRQGKADAAERLFKPYLGSPQHHLAGLVALTVIALHQNNTERAQLLADRLRRISSQDGIAWAMAGVASLRARLAEDSVRAYRAALGFEPNRLDYLIGLAYALLEAKQQTEAHLVLDKLQRINATHPSVVELALDLQLAGDAELISTCYFTPDRKLSGCAWNRTRTEENQFVDLVSAGKVLKRFKADKRSRMMQRKGLGDGCHAFHIALPEDAGGSLELRFSEGGTPLFGSPLVVPPDREGWLQSADGRYVQGWARNRQHPDEAVLVVVTNSLGQTRTVQTTELRPELVEDGRKGRLGFLADFGEPAADVLSVRYEAHFEGTDMPLRGSPMQAVVGSHADAALRTLTTWMKAHSSEMQALGLPLSLQSFLRRDVLPLAHWQNWRGTFKRRMLMEPESAGIASSTGDATIDVIIPIYRGVQETLACIDSVLAAKNITPMHLILVDDASPQPELSAALTAYARKRNVSLLRNAANLGFVGSINRAMAVHSQRDVVLLNSDTLVNGDWLDRLIATARSDPGIGTITPLSNDATICSYPGFNVRNPFPEATALAEIDKFCAKVNFADGVDIPTGVGFCMFIRRSCLDDAGSFDAETWGKGYGEENDFCLRATYLGWRHVAAPHVYIAHRGGVSFGIEGGGQLDANLKKLNALHPGYDQVIDEFLARDPLQISRKRLDLARIQQMKPSRSILFVTHSLGGGTERHVREVAHALAKEGVVCFTLRPDGSGRVRLDVPDEWKCPNLLFDAASGIDELTDLLRSLKVAHIHYHHFLDIPDALMEPLPKRLGCSYDVTIHDYSWICPQINLIDSSGRYCGEPKLKDCEECLEQLGSRLPGIVSVEALRARSADFLHQARAVFVPTEDAARRMQGQFPKTQISVRPHPETDVEAIIAVPLAQPGKKLRIAVIGALGDHKGYRELLACAEDAAKRDLALEFVVFGHTRDDVPLFRLGNVFVTGHYQEEELAVLLSRFRCDVALFLSVWPETWSYTLSAALANGLLPFAYDIGAFSERIRKAKVGVLLPLALPAAEINDLMIKAVELYRKSSPKRVRLGYPGYSGMLTGYYDLGPVGSKAEAVVKSRNPEPRRQQAEGVL